MANNFSSVGFVKNKENLGKTEWYYSPPHPLGENIYNGWIRIYKFVDQESPFWSVATSCVGDVYHGLIPTCEFLRQLCRNHYKLKEYYKI